MPNAFRIFTALVELQKDADKPPAGGDLQSFLNAVNDSDRITREWVFAYLKEAIALTYVGSCVS
jgi:hypothetical protein